jgi:hypothetical protein
MLRLSLLAVLILGAWTAILAQAPDWMFALEGTYVGRYEVPLEDPSDAATMQTLDARIDGKRSGAEDGFVLQIALEAEDGVVKEAQMWSWNSESNQLDIMAIQDGQRTQSHWFAEQSGPAVNLTRGGSVAGQAAIERLRLERLPGQLRLTKQFNTGDGQWTLLWRYVLDDFVSED